MNGEMGKKTRLKMEKQQQQRSPENISTKRQQQQQQQQQEQQHCEMRARTQCTSRQEDSRAGRKKTTPFLIQIVNEFLSLIF
jgi:hypothetical protein